MAKVLVTESSLQDIADAIRTKNGSTDKYTPAEMSDAIEAIPTGITPTGTKQISITQNGTTTEDVANYANAQISVNVPSSSPTLVTKNIAANGTYNASSDNADGYSSVTVNVPSTVEPFDTYEFNIPSDINYQDATGTSVRQLASITYHQAFLDKLAEYSSMSDTDYPFCRTGYARIMFRIEPKNKSQIVADSTYRKGIRKDSVYHMKVVNSKVSRASPYWRERWSLTTAGAWSYSGNMNTNNDANGLDVTIASESTAFTVQTQLSSNGDQMISAGDYVVKVYDMTWSVM